MTSENSLLSPSVKDVLAEIPTQVVQYMQRNGIKPQLPDVDAATRIFEKFNFN